MNTASRRSVEVLFGSLLVALVAGCGGPGSDEVPSSENVEGSTGAGGTSTSGSGSTGEGGFDLGSSGSDGTGGGGFEACATASELATLIPVNMFIAVDKSGSMADNDKWKNAKQAFIAFFQDPEADSLRVALRFWPDQGCDDNSCSTQNCSQPQVPLGPLSDPAHEQALINMFQSKSPNGLTPMSAALAGATKWAKEYQVAKESTEKVVVILLTDGEPTACEQNISDIASYATDAYQTAGVLTFAVGLQGSNEGQMDVIAQSGGTTNGFFIGNGNAQADLLTALKEIQKSTVACSFAMPESTTDKPVDPALVNVTYNGNTVLQVSGEGDCTAAGGWYYDDPADPAIISLCDTTCQMVQGDENAKIEIILGCKTEIH